MTTNGPVPTRRVNRGAGHSYYLDGEKVPGVTTVLNAGFPKSALVNWAAATTAGFAVDHWDELTELTPSKRLAELERARFAVSSEAKLRGTVIHGLAHRLVLGEEVEVPDEYRDHVDRCVAFLDDWQAAELMVETPVWSRRHRYAGTPDLVATLRDGRTWMLDWKTGLKGNVYLEHVLQIAACRYADFALDDAGVETPLPRIDATGVVILRADGYDLVPVEADERAFFVFRCVKWLAEFIDDREQWIGNALPPGVTA